MQELCLQDCWAKTDEAGRPALPVATHCLNVGYVGWEVASLLPLTLKQCLPQGYAALIACHDLGKISPGFLMKSPAWRDAWQIRLGLSAPDQFESRHAWISQRFLASRMEKPSRWLIAVGGHHGRYLCKEARPSFGKMIGTAPFDELRGELLQLLEREFGESLPSEHIEKGARLHWFTGLMIFADWIGSNTTWFPLAQVSEKGAEAARQALEEIGWHRYEVRRRRSFHELFGLASPRPLQQALHEAMDRPGLYIVEAPMGEGKTEAALYGAYRRWSEGAERGLYFALPTQLSSDRIHARVNDFLGEVVEDESTMALVHGNAWLRDARIQPLRPSTPAQNGEEPDPSSDGNRWFSDSRRALLAPFGVGTVDQALMAVIPVKFSALRMFALGGKVVVIDEVHSYDPYTSALVDRAVKWLLELGGTVIILSATLTAARRQSLLAAAGARNTPDESAYPLISKVATGSDLAEIFPISAKSKVTRHVTITRAGEGSETWMQEAAAAAEAGACVLVIRNTVALAQETFRQLSSRCRDLGIERGLIHSRFTQADRQQNESQWMKHLGKGQEDRPRHGAILVGTQVLEQSVDIDADFLITDVAPTDLILQRLGRLHRHQRPRPASFAKARCCLLFPDVDWQAEAKMIEQQLKPHGRVYPPFSLFMAMMVWGERSSISLPDEIRSVLEASVAAPKDLPVGLVELGSKLERETQTKIEVALRKGPFSGTVIDDLEGADTRWKMQPSGHLVILRSQPEQSANGITLSFPDGNHCSFTPGHFHFPLARLLQLHAIRVPLYMIRDLRTSAPPWLQQHLPGAALAILDEMSQLHPFPCPDSATYVFQYRSDLGLVPERNARSTFQLLDDDESWF